MSVPVSLQSFNVTLDLLLVERVVLGELLRQLGWVSEDLGPGLNRCDIIVHVLAGAEGLRDLQGRQAELESGLGVVVPAT